MSASATKVLYIGIWLLSFAFALMAQKTVAVNGDKKTIFRKLPFAISFLIPWFFYAFTDISHDYDTYANIYEIVTWENFDKLWVEPGYAVFNLLIKFFVKDSVTGVIIIKTIHMLLIYVAIYDYREKAHVGFAVLGYVSLMYLDAFCMIRINLAAALILYAISLYQNHNKKLLAIILTVCAVTIHYSALIFVSCFLVYILLFRNIRKYFYTKLVVLCGILLILSSVAVPLMDYILNRVEFLTKYAEKYSTIQSSGLGVMQIVFHLPFVLVALETWNIARQTESRQVQILALALVLAPMSLFFGSMGYSVEVIGRCFVYFIYLWSVALPAYYTWRKNIKPNEALIIGALIFAWSALRFYLYLDEHLRPAGIDQYYFIWQ